jgi:hypothetical protein
MRFNAQNFEHFRERHIRGGGAHIRRHDLADFQVVGKFLDPVDLMGILVGDGRPRRPWISCSVGF